MNLKIAYKTAVRCLTAELGYSTQVMRFATYFLPTLSVVWWMLSDLRGVSGWVTFIVTTIPMIYCLLSNMNIINNGALREGHICPYCGAGVLERTYCTVIMKERYRFTCGTIGVISGMTGITDHMGEQCLCNQRIADTVEEEDTI